MKKYVSLPSPTSEAISASDAIDGVALPSAL